MDEYTVSKNGVIISEHCRIARRYFERMTGLLKHKTLEPGEAMLICPCSQVHTFGMKFDIDVVFLSRDGVILEILRGMRPGRISRYVKRASGILELSSGTADENGLEIYDRLKIGPVRPAPENGFEALNGLG